MDATHGRLINCLSVKRATDAKHAVLTLVQIKHRTLETRINPHLIYLSRLEQVHVELMEECVEVHSGASGAYEVCTEFGVALRHDV